MRTLFPDIHPYAKHQIAVQEPHSLYVEESGNPKGIPILFVHGGPGAGCSDWHRRFFDPEIYRIILFDQRGCGLSKPHCHLENNTTAALVDDMESIRQQLKVDKWVLFGGSWGSTLSLVYAQAHPEQVLGLILRGVFLARPKEIEWLYETGANRFFPEHWERFVDPIKNHSAKDKLHAYYELLHGDNELQRMAAAKAWSIWEGSCSTLQPSKSVMDHFSDPHTALSLAQIETHYFTNQSFLSDNQILNNMDKIAQLPGIIVQGRYDMVCPLESACELYQAWPESRLEIIASAGHSAKEPGISDALVQATNEFAKLFK